MAYHITEACIGCTACARNCPVFAIAGERGQLHSINAARCVECGVCGRVCPKAAVTDGTGAVCAAVKWAEWLKPAVDGELCSACGICVNDCTPGALGISLPAFRGDIRVHAELTGPAKCVGCAICRDHCPLGAITMIAPAQPAAARSATPVLAVQAMARSAEAVRPTGAVL
jgi:formate hydrogenlyase subunit 6/NADH:ubiquinone oxidoreductase subunit I